MTVKYIISLHKLQLSKWLIIWRIYFRESHQISSSHITIRDTMEEWIFKKKKRKRAMQIIFGMQTPEFRPDICMLVFHGSVSPGRHALGPASIHSLVQQWCYSLQSGTRVNGRERNELYGLFVNILDVFLSSDRREGREGITQRNRNRNRKSKAAK